MREIVLLIDNYFKYVNSKEDYQKKYNDSFELNCSHGQEEREDIFEFENYSKKYFLH